LSHFVLVEDEGFDFSEWGEHILDLLVSPLKWDVLNIDVVDELSDLSSVLWLELDGLDGVSIAGGLEGLAGRSLILEADESVSSGGVVLVERDLQTLDVSVLGEMLLKVLVFHFLWELSHEDVVGDELVLVSTEQVFVELESSALLAIDLEVLHLLTGVLELLSIGDAENSAEEWSGVVSLDLWLGLKDHTSLVLEDLGQLNRGEVVLWEVV